MHRPSHRPCSDQPNKIWWSVQVMTILRSPQNSK
jgi:hypothetical protein